MEAEEGAASASADSSSARLPEAEVDEAAACSPQQGNLVIDIQEQVDSTDATGPKVAEIEDGSVAEDALVAENSLFVEANAAALLQDVANAVDAVGTPDGENTPGPVPSAEVDACQISADESNVDVQDAVESELHQTEVMEVDSISLIIEPQESVDTLKLAVQNLTNKLEECELQQLKDRENFESFRQQRDDAINERNTLMSMISRLNVEIGYMKELHSKTSQQLKNTIDSNCEIVATNKQLKLKEVSLQYREELMEREKTILDHRIQNLTEDLNKKNLELETLRIEKFSKISSLEIQVASKTEELNIAQNDIAHLRDQRLKLISEIGNLNKKLDDVRETESKMCDDLRKKLTAQTKISDLYKSMRDDSESKCKELVNGINEIKILLNDAIEKYGELESKKLKMEMDHDVIVKQKNNLINSLREDLENAKKDLEMKKTERFVSTMKKLSPTASVVCDFVKSGMSLVEIYNQLIYVSDELEKKTNENTQLNEALSTIVKDIEENAPFIKEQMVQNEENLDKNIEIGQQLESVELEYSRLREDYGECLKLNVHFEKDNKKLKQELNDLGQQVCFLLKEIEINRGGNLYGDKDVSVSTTSSSDHSSFQIISKNLVTFSDIQELQANNQKLLKLVRELCDKQEEMEVVKDQIDSGEYQDKLDVLHDKINDLSNTNERQSKTISGLIQQRNMYKKLYHKKGASQDIEFMDDDEDETSNNQLNESNKSKGDYVKNKNVLHPDEIKLKEQQLEETKKQLEQQKQDYLTYEKLSDSKEKLLLTKIDKLEKEVLDLNEKYRKYYGSSEANNEKNKILEANLVSYKKMLSDLQNDMEKARVKVVDYETSAKYLTEKIHVYENKLSQNNTTIGNLQKECKMLRELKINLLNDKEKLSLELHNQIALIANFETIKNTINKKQVDDKSKLDKTLQEFSRECSLLRRKLQDREDNLNKAATEGGSLEPEKDKSEILDLQEEVNLKSKTIEELSAILLSGEYGQLKEQIKSLKRELDEKKVEIDSLSQQMVNNNEHMKQFSSISEHTEIEKKTLNDQFEKYRQETELKLLQYESSFNTFKDKCSELEAELSLQNTNHEDLNTEISNAEENIQLLTQQLHEKSESFDRIQIDHAKMIDQVKSLEDQNSFFSATNIELNKQKSELQNKIVELNQRIANLNCEKVLCEEQLNEYKLTSNENIKIINLSKEQLEGEISELKNQNSLLHDQLETFNMQNILNQSSNQSKNLNDSVNIDFDSSNTESETKSHLLQIIKYLRKDRDFHGRKCDEIREENLKIKSELDKVQSNLNEIQKSQMKSNNDFQNSSNASLHFEMVNQLETLNTLSLSNTLLREERDKNLITIKNLSEKLKEFEEKAIVTQKSNEELSKKINYFATEKSCAQAECSRWKSRVSSLLEKTKRTNPEDWKRLQNERETLAKMLSTEKENSKKIREDITLMRLEKNKLEEQINSLNIQLVNLNDENKKQCAELRNDITQLSSDLSEARSMIKEKSEENLRLNENLNSINLTITEARTKETQLRKIAKLYKTQYETLTRSVEEDKKKTESTNNEGASISQTPSDSQKELEQKVIDLEKANSAKIAELEAQVSSSLEENNTLHKEIQSLKNKNENTEERAKIAMKQAQNKISQCTESNEILAKEVNDIKSQLDNLEQIKDEYDVRLAALKSQYEGRLLKLEKEKNQQQQSHQNETAQLNKQIETLNQKIAQMQRQIDVQSTKPSTSSSQIEKSGTEPPTANIKPMAGSQTPVGSRRLGCDTPLASIKPMTSVPAVRTAAILPTTVSSHQTSHASGTTIGDSSPSPSSSLGTEYLPASSSTANCLHLSHAQSNQQTHTSPPESTQDTESDNLKSDDAVHVLISATLSSMSGNQQAVALVSPRMETSNDEHVQLTSSNNGSSSTVTTSYSNPVDQSNENRESSTTQKRLRNDFNDEKPLSKRAKVQEATECEYQVPTSSQKDQEDDSVIVVDSDDEDNDENDCEESNLYMDDIDDEDEDEDEENDDDDDGEDEDDDDDDDDDEEEEEDEEDEEAEDRDDDGNEVNEEGIDDDNDREDEEEIIEEIVGDGDEDDIADAEEAYEQDDSAAQSEEEIENETEAAANSICEKTDVNTVEYIDDASENSDEEKDAITLSSRSESSTILHSSNDQIQILTSNAENVPRSSFLTLRPSVSGINSNTPGGSYEEGGDSIVPSTPTLYVPNRNDGFGEAVRSPSSENVGTGRFSFNPNNSQGVMENTHADLTAQLSSHQNQISSDISVNRPIDNNVEGFDNTEANEAVRNLEASFTS